MVDENEVKRWIARLETEESSWKNYERLAVLYAIRDQQSGSRERALPMAYSAAPAPVNVEHTATATSCAQWQIFRRTRRGRSWTS